MISIPVLLLTEDEYNKSHYYKEMWKHHVVLVEKPDGTIYEVKGRWTYPCNEKKFEIYLP